MENWNNDGRDENDTGYSKLNYQTNTPVQCCFSMKQNHVQHISFKEKEGEPEIQGRRAGNKNIDEFERAFIENICLSKFA